MKGLIPLLGLMTLVLFAACDSGGDEARERVTQKKDITETVAERKTELQAIDMAKVPSDSGELQKIILMSAEEMAQRMGSGRMKAKLSFTITRDDEDVQLDEEQEYDQAKNGDFRVAMLNDKAKTYELYWVDGKQINRSSSPKFRMSTSTGKHLFWREKMTNSLSRFYKYFRGHLTFTDGGVSTYEGRKVRRVILGLNPAGKTPEKDIEVTFNYPSQYRLSSFTSERLLNRQRKKITDFVSAEGELLIDLETAVILKYDFQGQYRVPVNKKFVENSEKEVSEKSVQFTYHGTMQVTDVGKTVEIKAPPYDPPMKRNKPDPKALDHLPKGSKVHLPPPGTPKKAEPLPQDQRTGTR